jgi:hypothetical protein
LFQLCQFGLFGRLGLCRPLCLWRQLHLLDRFDPWFLCCLLCRLCR